MRYVSLNRLSLTLLYLRISRGLNLSIYIYFDLCFYLKFPKKKFKSNAFVIFSNM